VKTRTDKDKKRDRELVREGLARVREGKKMSRPQELAADRLKEDEVWEYVTSCTPKFFQRLSTLPGNMRVEWEDRYGIPCGRSRQGINLQDVFKSIRKLIADHKIVLNSADGSSSLTRTKTEKEIEKLNQQIRKLANQSHQIEKNHVRVDVMRDRIQRLANLLSTLGDQLARKTSIKGKDAQKMLNATLKNFQKEIETMGQ